MVFKQILNKFCIATKNKRDIQFINLICNRQPPNNFSISDLFYTNLNLCRNTMKTCSLTR